MLPEQQQRIMGYFIEEAKDHLNTIEQGLLSLQSTIEDSEKANELFRAAHSVKGGAAMLGLGSIQTTAHRMEDYFKILKESPVQVDSTLETMFLKISDGLKDLLEQLEGPFGLTPEKAQEIMAGVEPVFGQLEKHLNTLVGTAGSDREIATDSISSGALRKSFKDDVASLLRQMLATFKQSDTSESRQNLQSICEQLSAIGKQFELAEWCDLIETARLTSANLNNNYRTLAPILIKEIKQSQNLVLAGRASEVSVSEAMQDLLPADILPPAADGLEEVGLGEIKSDTSDDFEDTTFDLDFAIPRTISQANTSDTEDLFGEALFEEKNAPNNSSEGELDNLFDFESEMAELSDLSELDLTPALEHPHSIETKTAKKLEVTLPDDGEEDKEPTLLNLNLDFNEIPSELSALNRNTESEERTDESLDALLATVNVTGPDVGAEELTSLADLFDGDLEELDNTLGGHPFVSEEMRLHPEKIDLGEDDDLTDLLVDDNDLTSLTDEKSREQADTAGDLEDDLFGGTLTEGEFANSDEFDWDSGLEDNASSEANKKGLSAAKEDPATEAPLNNDIAALSEDVWGEADNDEKSIDTENLWGEGVDLDAAVAKKDDQPYGTENDFLSDDALFEISDNTPATSDTESPVLEKDDEFAIEETSQSQGTPIIGLFSQESVSPSAQEIEFPTLTGVKLQKAEEDIDSFFLGLSERDMRSTNELNEEETGPVLEVAEVDDDPWGELALEKVAKDSDSQNTDSQSEQETGEVAFPAVDFLAVDGDTVSNLNAEAALSEELLENEADALFDENIDFEAESEATNDEVSTLMSSVENVAVPEEPESASTETIDSPDDLFDSFSMEADANNELALSDGSDFSDTSLDDLALTSDNLEIEGSDTDEKEDTENAFLTDENEILSDELPTENPVEGASIDNGVGILDSLRTDLFNRSKTSEQVSPEENADSFESDKGEDEPALSELDGLFDGVDDTEVFSIDDELNIDDGFSDNTSTDESIEDMSSLFDSDDFDSDDFDSDSSATDDSSKDNSLADELFADTSEKSVTDENNNFLSFDDTEESSNRSSESNFHTFVGLTEDLLEESMDETVSTLEAHSNTESVLADAGSTDEEVTAQEEGLSDVENNDFGDLEALLGEESIAAETVPQSSLETTAEVTPVVDDHKQEEQSVSGADEEDFDDLERLLEEGDGDRSLAAAPRRTAPRAARRTVGTREQNMRVPVKHLDNLSNLVGELVVSRNTLERDQERLRQFLDNLLFQVQQLNDVGQRMRDLYERSLLESSLVSNRRAYAASNSKNSETAQGHVTGATFDALEMDRFTGFHTLSQEMIELIVRVRESSSDIGYTVESSDQVTRQFRQITTQLQEGLNTARMVAFSQAADRLPRAVRDIALKCGKAARLAVEGKDTLIDKMIVEHLYDPLTHLVNNAITHGIETPKARQAAGKPTEGTITVQAFYQGNQTVIYVADDGGGINPAFVQRKAVEKGLIDQSEADQLSDIETYELLFHPGFSTRDQADDFAGRGVGMDVVRTSLAEIRGVITIDSEQGKGTSFTIRLPLTLSISKALSCVSNQARIAFPMDGVEDMLDVSRDRVVKNEQGQDCVKWRDRILPFQAVTDLLKFNRTLGRGRVYGGSQDDDVLSIIVLRSANTFVAIQVDQVIGEEEIVIKQLEGPVPKPLGIAGATILGDGRVMPIADVLELIDIAMGRVRREPSSLQWAESAEPEEEVQTKTDPTVLIVDDSITVRELLSMSFNKVGYRVEQARDGQEAWDKLRSGLPCDLVFCDIEMPRMDGLELLSRMQKDNHLKQVPIAMLTSRGADRHRQMAVDLGASGYFTKPYLEEALLDAAQRMLNGETLEKGRGG